MVNFYDIKNKDRIQHYSQDPRMVDESKYKHLREIKYPFWCKLEKVGIYLSFFFAVISILSIFFSLDLLYKYSFPLTCLLFGVISISIGSRAILLKKILKPRGFGLIEAILRGSRLVTGYMAVFWGIILVFMGLFLLKITLPRILDIFKW